MTTRSSRRRLIRIAAVALVPLLAACGTKGKDKSSDTTKAKQQATTTEPTTTEPTTIETTTTETPTTATPSGEVPDLSEWVSVSDTGSTLKFKLPTTPKTGSPAVTAPDGTPVTVRTYNSTVNPNLFVQVVIYDLAGRTFDPDKALDGVATQSQGSVKSRKHVNVGGLDVVDGVLSLKSGVALGYDRVFKAGDQAVQLQTVGLPTKAALLSATQKDLISTFSAS